MRTFIALAVLLAASGASAQDSHGRQRQPGGGGSTHGGSGSSGSGSSGSGSGSGRSSGGSNDGGWRRNDPPATDRGGSERPSYDGGGARRRVPRPDTSSFNGSRTDPGGNPSRDASLGHAVRRDSLPSGSYTGHFGDLDPRGWNEHGYDTYYWHEHRGHRYCHYVDAYGTDWYYWYYDDGYYTMRYYDGMWWRYHSGRWVYLYDGGWYYQEGPQVYQYEESASSYQPVDDAPLEPVTPSKISVTANLGHFGLNQGGAGSVVNENHSYLDFDGSMGGVSADAEVNVGLNKYLEAGLGVGYQKASADTRYTDYVNEGGGDIRQNMSLTNVPMNVNLKLMPFGRDQRFQPYVGAGLQVNKWNYQEKGQFIDFASPNYDIYQETYKAGGVAVGPIAIVGLKIPLNNKVAIDAEYRHQWAKGDLPKDGGFAGDHVDLGGGTIKAGVTFTIK